VALDEGIARLSESERAAVVLRYFQGKTHLDIAAALGIREEAARKRVQRGLEKLRAFFAARGAIAPSLSASGLASAISTHALTSAPQSLVAQLSSGIASAVTGAAPAAASTNALIHSAKGVITLMVWTKIKTSLVMGLLLVLLVGGGAVAVHAFSSRSHDDLVAIRTTSNSAAPAPNLATQPAIPAQDSTDYTLAPGEVLKRIAKPDRGVREQIWPYLHGHEPDSMFVEWTDKPEISRQTYGGGQSLDGMLS